MRESIGTTFMLNFIILFIFLVFAFLAGTFSYYKAYRVNNSIVNAIERYEGYNDYSINEINARLATLSYETTIQNTCPSKWKMNSINVTSGFVVEGALTTNASGTGRNGYCIYLYQNDNGFKGYNNGGLEMTDNYYTYGVLTYLQIRFPGFGYVLRIPIFSRTNRMYHFE